jgi:hypothetical protein
MNGAIFLKNRMKRLRPKICSRTWQRRKSSRPPRKYKHLNQHKLADQELLEKKRAFTFGAVLGLFSLGS